MESTARKDISASRSQAQIVTSPRFVGRPPEIALLQECFLRMRREELSAADFAYEAREFLEILVRVETGLLSLRQGLLIFLDKFCAEPYIVKLLQFLFKQAQNLDRSADKQKRFDKQKALSQIDEVLHWYMMRKASLLRLSEHYTSGPHYDHLFDLRVFHDQTCSSVAGFEVTAGIGLFGRSGQNLWYKVFVKNQGEYVLPRVDWNSWIDDTEIFTTQKRGSPQALSAIVPICPITQRLVIDRLSAFIPYAALDLPTGKNDVQIEAALFNERGDCLLKAESQAAISSARTYASVPHLVSSQALGIWSKDFVSGDSLTALEVSCQRLEHNATRADHIKIKFDMEVLDRAGQTVAIEARFYRRDGSSIVRLQPHSSDSGIAIRKELTIDGVVFRMAEIELSLPRHELKIEAHDTFLSCEVCLLSADSRVLCGMLASLELPKELPSEVQNSFQGQTDQQQQIVASKSLFTRLSRSLRGKKY